MSDDPDPTGAFKRAYDEAFGVYVPTDKMDFEAMRDAVYWHRDRKYFRSCDAGMSKMDAWPILSPMTHESAPDDGASLSAGLRSNARTPFEIDPVKAAEFFRRQPKVLP